MKTSWGDILHCLLAYFEYAEQTADFEYFMHCSSNELFVKPGAYQQFSQYDAGVIIEPKEHTAKWGALELAQNETC